MADLRTRSLDVGTLRRLVDKMSGLPDRTPLTVDGFIIREMSWTLIDGQHDASTPFEVDLRFVTDPD